MPDFCPTAGCGAALNRPPDAAAARAVRLAVESRGLAVGPGQTARLRLRVRNEGTQPDEYWFDVAGLPPGWVRLEPDMLTVAPGSVGRAIVTCTVPRSTAIPPGELTATVYAASHEDPGARARGTFGVRVRSLVAPVVVPVETEVHGRRRVRTSVVLRNEGNVPAAVRVRAHDPSGRVTATCVPRGVQLAPGASADVDVRLMFWTGRLLGRPRRSTVWFVADVGSVSRRAAVSCEQRSLVPRWFYRVFRIAAREVAAHHGVETAAGEAAAGAARTTP